MIHILTYYVVEVAPITFIVTPVYKLFVVKLVETLKFSKRKTWIKYLILNRLYAGPAPRIGLPKPVSILVAPLLFNIKKKQKKTLYIYYQFQGYIVLLT